MIYLMSDCHFNHKRIGEYCNRPKNWQDLIISNCQEIVKPEDTVVNLGDFGFGPVEALREIREQLPGDLVMVEGNHDFGKYCKKNHLENLGADVVLRKHGDGLTINDSDYPATFVCIRGSKRGPLPKDPRPEGDVTTIALSHWPCPGIRWPYFYGHVHNNPLAWDDQYKPYPLGKIQGRCLCVEVINYLPVPLPALLHDERWLEDNWEDYFRHFFKLDHPSDARSK